jgi:hypothetical protein
MLRPALRSAGATLISPPLGCEAKNALPMAAHLKQNFVMEQQTGIAAAIKDFVQWSIKPPQAYVTYVVCLVLVLGVSFYAGTLKPKRTLSVPQATAQPGN